MATLGNGLNYIKTEKIMKNQDYIAFVELGGGMVKNEIAIKVSVELQDDEYEALQKLISEYDGDKQHISKYIKQQCRAVHNKLSKDIFDDVRYMLVKNAVNMGYSEFTEEDLFEQDCDNGSFEQSENEDADNFDLWKKAETDKLALMSRVEVADYLSNRYEIELDFDENDYDYRFVENGGKNVETEFIE